MMPPARTALIATAAPMAALGDGADLLARVQRLKDPVCAAATPTTGSETGHAMSSHS